MKFTVVASGLRQNLAPLVLLLFLLALPPLTAAGESPRPGYIQIVVANDSFSSSPRHIQVRDEVCKEPRNIECEEARIKATGETCKKHAERPECVEAAELTKSSLCVEGLVYDGRLSRDEEVQVEVCTSNMGIGNVSVRSTENGNGIWTNYVAVANGRRISYH